MAYSCCWSISADKGVVGVHTISAGQTAPLEGRNMGWYRKKSSCMLIILAYSWSWSKKQNLLCGHPGALKLALLPHNPVIYFLLMAAAGVTVWEATTHHGQVNSPSQDMHYSLKHRFRVQFTGFWTAGGNCNTWNTKPTQPKNKDPPKKRKVVEINLHFTALLLLLKSPPMLILTPTA